MRHLGHKVHKTKIIITAIASLLLLAIIGAAILMVWYHRSVSAVDSHACDSENCLIAFTVNDGDTAETVSKRLEEAGLIRSSLAYRVYVKLEARDKVIRSGNYELSKDMTVAKIVEAFNVGPDSQTFSITFLPGGTLADARTRLKAKGYSDDEISKAFLADYDHELLKDKPADASLEGYIYGETYEFYKDATVEEILERCFDEMYKEVKENNLIAKFNAQGLNLHEGIVLASVVQRESGVLPDDMASVAQVFLNRLAQGIPLGSDAIIAYWADLQDANRDKTDMSYLTTTPCPWNSRQCGGLPPTGISTPGAGALEAVANPSGENYLYFLTGDDGKMYYGTTEAEHNANIQNHCQEMCQIL